jgi:hypothetical protein
MNIHRPHARKEQHGIHVDSRGQDQPVDKSRAQQTSVGEECPEKSHGDTATTPWNPPAGEKIRRRVRSPLIASMLQMTIDDRLTGIPRPMATLCGMVSRRTVCRESAARRSGGHRTARLAYRLRQAHRRRN